MHTTSANPQHGVAPRHIASTFYVALGNIHTTDIAHQTINHNNLAVVTIVHLTGKRRESHRHKRAHLDTRLAHPFKKAMVHIPTTHIIVNHLYLNTLAGLVYQGIGHQHAQGVVGKNIHIQMYVILGLADILHQLGYKLIAIGTDIHQVILKRQRQVLVNKQINQWFVALGQSQVLLLSKLQHRTLGKLVHRTFAHIALLAMVNAKKQIKDDAHHWHKINHQCPSHRLCRLTVVHNHVYHRHDSNDLVHYEYDIQPTHRPNFFATSL